MPAASHSPTASDDAHSVASQDEPAMNAKQILGLFTEVRRREILRNPCARSCIALVLWCQKRPMAPILRTEAGTTSWGAACIYIIVNKVSAFIPVSSDTATLLYGSPYGNHGEGRGVCVWCNGRPTVLECITKHTPLGRRARRPSRRWRTEAVGYLDLFSQSVTSSPRLA